MIAIQILEPHDLLQPTDWCRPLLLCTMSGGQSDYYSFTCCYTGQPENNVKWVQAHEIFGEHFMGRPIADMEHLEELGYPYEFVRGAIPKAHQYGITRRQARKAWEKYLAETVSLLPKYKGKTWRYIHDNHSTYFEWATSEGLVKRLEDFEHEG